MNKINISQIDTLFVNGNYPIELLLYFDYTINSEIIKRSIKELSTVFWALFGKYENGQLLSVAFEEDLFFKEKTVNDNFDLNEKEIEIWRKYHQTNPEKMGTLFFLSVLQFNNGTVIIPKMNHLVGDGYSYFYFLSVLSKVFRILLTKSEEESGNLNVKINNNRTILKEFIFNKNYPKDSSKFENLSIKIEKVQKEKVTQIMDEVKEKFNESVSANDILSAIVFKRLSNNQEFKTSDDFTLSIPIDVRLNVKELGILFFGNGILIHHLTIKCTELVKVSIEELSLIIRKSMPKINMQTYKSYLTNLENSIESQPTNPPKPYNPEKGCLVTNLTRMPVHRLNFGSGKPNYVFPLTIGKNSVAILKDKESYILRFVY